MSPNTVTTMLFGHEILGVKLLQVLGRELLHRFGRAALDDVIGRFGRQGVAEEFADLGVRIVGPAGDCPQGQLLHLGIFVLRKSRPGEALGEQGGRRRKIVPQRRGAAEHGEAAGVQGKLAADRIEELGDLRGRVVGRAHVEHVADQRRPAGRCGAVGQRADKTNA